MRTYNMHAAKTNLSRLVAEAADGKPFIIARGGQPLVKVVPLEPADRPIPLFGCMAGEGKIPDDFDTMGQDEIIAMFEGEFGNELEE